LAGDDKDEISRLLRRSASDDRKAFAALYRATSSKLYAIILRILNDRALASDVLQEVYVKIWRSAGQFDPAKSAPTTWLAAIARNRALDEVRRRRPAPVEIDNDAEIAAEMDDPLAGRDRAEELRKLLACLDGLDAQRRQALLLAYYRGLSREALAVKFERPVATIKTWLHRSLIQLRECLAK
jgi:RNA polymerase sigma-70 factor (ECF subfamily)